MSIATVGPKKYDFQDLVCLDFILNNIDKRDINFLIEPDGKEDAFFSYMDEEQKTKSVEVQVKGSENHVTLSFVAECLLHFPDRLDQGCLFDRMVEDENLYIVLVMTGRATDSLLKFIPKGEWRNTQHQDKITIRDADSIKLEFHNLVQSIRVDTQLAKKRKAHIQQIIDNYDSKQAKTYLRRLIIVDGESESDVKARLCSKLHLTYRVPDAHVDSTIDAAIKQIKSGKDSQDNVIPSISNILNEASCYSVKPSNYVKRGDEDAFIGKLINDHLLLLSGKPRVGKSLTARWIAASFQVKGYKVKITSDVFEAFRFLEDPVQESRLVLIDDPLGGNRAESKATDIWLEIKKKLQYITDIRRKVILVQGQEILFEVTDEEKLQDINISSIRWHDLSFHSDTFLETYWKNLKKIHRIPEELFLTVAENLNNQMKDIELGSLDYLAVEYSKLDSFSDISHIIRFARKDSRDLGVLLKNDGHKEALVGLALTTSGLNTIQDIELAYVLSNSKEKQYGFSNSLGVSYTLGADSDREPQKFPEYSDKVYLSELIIDSLDKLEQKRMTYWDDDNKISFTHPFYRAAAESLVNLNSRGAWPRVKEQLSNGIFCLSPTTSKLTAKNLHWIFQSTTKKFIKESVIELAKDGLNSSYPSTRDACFDLLMKALNDSQIIIPEEEQTKWLSSISFNSLSNAEWHNGQPWYPMGEKVLISGDILKSLGILAESESKNIATVVKSLNNDDRFLFSPQDAFDSLSYCLRKPNSINELAIMRILSLDEGQIRALAAKVWLSVEREKDENVQCRIFEDQHPSVAEAIYETLVSSWGRLSEKRRETILCKLQKMVISPYASAIILPELLKFNREEVTGNKPPWDIFYNLLPIVLDNVYQGVYVNFPRLDRVVYDAILKHGYNRIIPILESWVRLLEIKSVSNFGGGYDTAVISYMLKVPDNYNFNRFSYIERLLKIKRTEHSIRVISLLIDHWDSISNQERDLVKNILSEDRIDLVWLKSSVLIRPQIPKILLNIILNKNIEEVTFDCLLNIENKLKKASIILYQEEFFISIPCNSENRTSWQKLIYSIINEPEHSLYKLCFEYALSNRSNDRILAEVITQTDEIHLNCIFDILISYAIRTNGEYRPLSWEALFLSASSEEMKNVWLNQMAEKSGLYLDSISEIDEWLPKQYVQKFYAYMNVDFTYIKIFKEFSDIKYNPSSEFFETSIQLIEKLPPNHYQTCEYVQKALKNIVGTEKQIERIEVVRKKIIGRRLEVIDEINIYERQNWLR